MRKAAAILLAILVGGLVSARWDGRPALAGGANDPNESRQTSPADIRSITARRDGATLIYSVEMYGAWKNSDLAKKGVRLQLNFFTGSGRVADRTISLANDGRDLVATLSAKHGRSWPVTASRLDTKTVEFRVPRRRIEGPRRLQTYEWYAFVDQAYAEPIPCRQESPSASPSPAASPSPSASPTTSPSPSPTECGHKDVFFHDRAPDDDNLTEIFREIPKRDKQPPDATLRRRRPLLKLLPWSWAWSYPSGNGSANVIADGFPSWPSAGSVKPGQCRIRFDRSGKAPSVEIVAYPRLGPHRTGQGHKERISVTLRRHRRDGRTVGWDALFSLAKPGRDYYMDVYGQWSADKRHLSSGSAHWSLHLATI